MSTLLSKATQRVSVRRDVSIRRDFRVEQVAGLFDLQLSAKSALAIDVPLPDPAGAWTIGAIVGKSGDGKSSVAREAYGAAFIEPGAIDWPDDAAIVSAFPKGASVRDVTGTLSAVGFSSPPDWVKPYRVLSGGQRMRCDLARVLHTEAELLAFDEFTSVVDRQVGQAASHAVQKAIRERRVPLRRFVAVTCHYDVLAWLQPDWVLDMSKRQLARGWLRRERCAELFPERPPVRFSVHRIDADTRARLWPAFARHHYLSAKLHRAARCYAAVVTMAQGEPEAVGFCATLANAGHAGRRRVSRLVVLPDYQGLGVGLRLLEAVAEHESATHRVSIRTSHPALLSALQRRAGWRLTDVSRQGSTHRGYSGREGRGAMGSAGRSVASFDFRRVAPK